MSEKELQKTIVELREYFMGILSSKEKSQKFLIELGTHDADGGLTNNYK